jgi:alkanesulfonate monooxygenase SsuD/methylene tetrahydromethanopterin reductase-like flavin-dependent oxidoreductase (luciferase family)
MRLGVVSPQTETGSDPAVIRDYAQAAEGAGYDHLLVFDHVLGGKLDRGQNWRRGAGGRPCRERRLPSTGPFYAAYAPTS